MEGVPEQPGVLRRKVYPSKHHVKDISDADRLRVILQQKILKHSLAGV